MSDILYDIAIVGGGPGGIGSAVEAALAGFKKIIMIEKGDNHSQTIRKFYKDNKRVDRDWKGQSIDLKGGVDFADGTKESTIDFFDNLISSHRMDTLFNTEVEKISKENDLFLIKTSQKSIQAAHVIIAIGKMGKPNKPNYELPLSLKSVINFNLDHCNENERILVVGGGNSAVEYAYELANFNTVFLSYRQNNFSRVNPENLEILMQYSDKNKIQILLNTDIVGVNDLNGKPEVVFVDKKTIFDRIIYAIGGTTPSTFLQGCGVLLDDKGEALFDKNFETNITGLFVAGDIAVRNGGSIAIALNHAHAILSHIQKKENNKCS